VFAAGCHSLSTVCQYLQYTACCFSVTFPLLGSTFCPLSASTSYCTLCWFGSPCPLLPSTVCALSLSTTHCTVCCILDTVYSWHLNSVQYLSVYHTELSLVSVSLCPVLFSTISPLSVSTSNSTVVSVSKYRLLLSTVCPLSVIISHCTVFVSVTVCLLLFSTACPLSVSASQWTVFCFCVTMPTAALHCLSNVFGCFTLYRLLVLCPYVHCCFVQSVHCLSVPHNVPSVYSVSLCPLLLSKYSPLSVNTLYCTVCLFGVSRPTAPLFSLSNVCQYHRLFHKLDLCLYVHFCVP
jgi:hypothetical protein